MQGDYWSEAKERSNGCSPGKGLWISFQAYELQVIIAKGSFQIHGDSGEYRPAVDITIIGELRVLAVGMNTS